MFNPSNILPPKIKLNKCGDVHILAALFNLTYEELSKLIYPTPNRSYYQFAIDKKNGSKRVISAPKKKLKIVQKKIADELLTLYPIRDVSHGFIKGKSIVSNAEKHVLKSCVLNIDLEDFFGSIHFGRVRNLLTSPSFNIPLPVATVISNICCYNGSIPQGAPTSPIISNLICYKLDNELRQLAGKYNCTYTRYVDDITFSFTYKAKRIPHQLVTSDSNIINIGVELEEIITRNGFSINKNKTRLQSKNERQTVTGIVVNKKTNLQRKFIRQTSSMLYAWEKHGVVAAENEHFVKYNKKNKLIKLRNFVDKPGELFKRIVKGRINYIKMVRGEDDIIYRKFAHRISCLFGNVNNRYLKTPSDFAIDSIFILENEVDISQGTAFLLEDVGIVTNYHVVPSIDEYNDIDLSLFRYNELDNKRKVKFIMSNKLYDLAIFDTNGNFDDIKKFSIGDDSNLKVGSEISVIGFPQYTTGEYPYINTGKIVQSKSLFNNKIWLVDIPIIHGNSGGPVFNEKFEIIGVASNGTERNDQSSKLHGFIPISTLIKFISSK
ncbi:reverse transcriptase domain-containing protein [Yersinia enterocolitica]